jgi:hypothetical protein
MKALWRIVLVLLAAGCSAAPVARVAKPAFKGMELYSWKPEGKEWHFSVLEGTNRNKTMAEITAPEDTLVGVAPLKKRLARLAKGESVFWRNLADESVPQDMEEDLRAFCQGIDVTLHPIWDSSLHSE